MLCSLILTVAILAKITSASDLPILQKHIFPSGRQIPSIGFGTYGWETQQRALNSYVQAIDNGYRVFDTANIYDNRVAIGLAIRQQINAKRITRRDVFIISKVWNTEHKPTDAVANIKNDLRDLDVEQLDLALLHYPTSFQKGSTNMPTFSNGSFIPAYWEKDRGYIEGYRGLEAAFLLGLVGQIGLSNTNIHQLKKILDVAFIRPVVLEVECHPLFSNDKLVKFAQSNNMTVICYAPLRSGTKEFLNDPVLKEIADKHKKNVQQVALRWNMQRGTVVIPRSHDRRHQRENIEALTFSLDDQDMKKINEIKELPKLIDMPNLSNHPDYPFGANADAD